MAKYNTVVDVKNNNTINLINIPKLLSLLSIINLYRMLKFKPYPIKLAISYKYLLIPKDIAAKYFNKFFC